MRFRIHTYRRGRRAFYIGAARPITMLSERTRLRNEKRRQKLLFAERPLIYRTPSHRFQSIELNPSIVVVSTVEPASPKPPDKFPDLALDVYPAPRPIAPLRKLGPQKPGGY